MSSAIRIRDNKASTLVELLISMFLLFAGFLIIFRLFQVSMQYNTSVENRLTASRIASKTMDEVRAWARDPSNYDNNWDSTYPGIPYQDPDDSKYTVTVLQENHEALSPCTSLEQRWVPSGKERRFTRSFRKVTVRVAWSGNANDRLSLTSLIGDPPRELQEGAVEISYPDGMKDLAPDETQLLAATLRDVDGNAIPDVCFEWYVIPGTMGVGQGGNGIIDHDQPRTLRSGRQVMFRNMYPHPGGWQPIRGRVRMRALSYYRRARQFRINETFWRNRDS